jgi:broad specificity phosphatase PhoE
VFGVVDLWLVRHGETEWSAAGRHTGRTDLPLTAAGEEAARGLGERLAGTDFARVLTSPLGRARDTCRLAGLSDRAEVLPDLREWDYGDYEGLTTPQIRDRRPGWSLWSDGCPNGESAADVGGRADKVISDVRAGHGPVAVFSHGHMLRVLAARWIGLDPAAGALLALDTASVSVLGYEREQPVIRHWNT